MKIDVERLRAELPDKRWFGEKSRSIRSVEIVDHGILSEGDENLLLAIVQVTFTEGAASLYHLPLLVSEEGHRDATEDPDRLRILGDALAHGHPIKGEHGVFHFSGPGLDPSNPPGEGSTWTISSEQSNTSVVFDDSVILKFFRKVETGPNPDLELARLLTNEGFRSIPEQVGEIFYEAMPDEESVPEGTKPADIDLAIAQRFIAGGREGWQIALEQLDHLFNEIHDADVPEDLAVLVEERSKEMLSAVEQLGDVTASLHVTLAREDIEDEFRPETVTEDDLRSWVEATHVSLERISLKSPELAAFKDKLVARTEGIAQLSDGGSKIRIHGDYHLGQVLRVPRLWYILDLEGEPARSLEERRAKQSPLKDVAGMLRSLSYAAYASLYNRVNPDDEEWKRLEPWALTWEELARERFLMAYLAKSHEGRFLPAEHEAVMTLLDLFELDKAIYEVGYEVDSRPEWLRIPLRGIARLIERGEVK